jgi:Protamine and protamine like
LLWAVERNVIRFLRFFTVGSISNLVFQIFKMKSQQIKEFKDKTRGVDKRDKRVKKKDSKSGDHAESGKCQPGKVTRNAFLNYLRTLRRTMCGSSVVAIAVEGGKRWRAMSEAEKQPYYQEALKGTSSKSESSGHATSGGCQPGKVTRNAFLNYLRSLRRTMCGKDAATIAIEGGKRWHAMSEAAKQPYYQEAQKASRSPKKTVMIKIHPIKKQNRKKKLAKNRK